MLKRLTALLFLIGVVTSSWAQGVSWVGNTNLYLTGIGQIPTKGAFIEKWQSVSVTTQTYPIANGQTVTAIVTTDNWLSSQEYVFTYDFQVGNNSQWYVVLGPYPPGTDLQFYIRANGTGNTVAYDNNSTQNFGFYTRYSPAARSGPILQWFETDYRTIMLRLPEVVQAGYSAIYLPCPQKSGGGQSSVGYNPFDHFDLGDRLVNGTVRTRYGTTQELQELMHLAKRFGIEIYCDAVFNHMDNRASTAIDRYPDMIAEDFHVKSSADTSNQEINFNNESAFSFGMLNYDLIGLADIAHEDNNNTRTGTFTLPAYASFNSNGKPSFIRHPRTAQYYPSGAPAAEDVREYLKRWGWFLTAKIGFDGLRLDAAKHVPPAFWDNALGQPGSPCSRGELLPYLYGLKASAYIFGENFTSNSYELREFEKTGMNMLDFPLKFNLDNLFNSNGYNNISQALGNNYGLDSATGIAYERGGLSRDTGVAFVQSHDQGPPFSNNIAFAFTLSKPGRSLVYYDGNNVQPGNYSLFPKPGRADALGSGSDLLLKIVDATGRYGRGTIVNRWTAEHLYIYERQVNGYGTMLVGLNNRGDNAPLSATVSTGFAPGQVLRDYSGQMPDLTVSAGGQVALTVPPNTDVNSTNNARGYVLYAPLAPETTNPNRPVRLFDPADSNAEIGFDAVNLPRGSYGAARTFNAATISQNLITVQAAGDSLAASCYLKLDNGLPIAGLTPIQNSDEGLRNGFISMAPLGGNAFQTQNVDLSDLDEGLHCFRARFFTTASARPAIYRDYFAFFYVKRPRGISADGDLTDLGSPLVTQGRTPTSQSNRLDGLYAANDDQYVYLGLAGNVDPSENLTNGISLFLDTDPAAGTGVRSFGTLEDDSGPAARLLSNANVTGSATFGAEFALSVLRRSKLSSAPEANFAGGIVTTPGIGAFAGLFQIDPNHLNWLIPKAAAIAFQSRNSSSDPPKGMEAAIPIKTLFPNGVDSSPSLGLMAYMNTTGESGVTLPAANVSRGSFGGYGNPQSYVLNQFLPTQGSVQGDPGVAAVTAQNSTRYFLHFATPQPQLRVMQLIGGAPVQGVVRYKAKIWNRTPQSFQGPITLRLQLPDGVRLIDKTGDSLRNPQLPYKTFEGSLAPASQMPITLDFFVPSGKELTPKFEIFSGRGVL